MNKQFTYKPGVLVEMAQEYLEAERSYRDFIAQHKNQYGSLVLGSADDRVSYWVKDKESSCAGSALSTACRLVRADVNTVIATAKAMNRFEKRERWQVCAHLPTGWCSRCGEYGEYGEDRVRRFFAAREWDADFFQSTGRRHPWAA